eukprot:1196078-Prorocentrum_minimum.AAC.12
MAWCTGIRLRTFFVERGGGRVGRWTVFSALIGWVSGSSGLLYCLSRDELHPLLGGPAAGIQALRGCRIAGGPRFGVLERISWDLVVGLGVFGATPKMDSKNQRWPSIPEMD